MRLRDAMVTRGSKTYGSWWFSGTWPSALDMNQHIVQYGRMFNAVDDENAATFVSSELGARCAFGSPEKIGRESFRWRADQYQGNRFTIIGMFQHYESEEDVKKREWAKSQPASTNAMPVRPVRKVLERSGGNNWVFQ